MFYVSNLSTECTIVHFYMSMFSFNNTIWCFIKKTSCFSQIVCSALPGKERKGDNTFLIFCKYYIYFKNLLSSVFSCDPLGYTKEIVDSNLGESQQQWRFSFQITCLLLKAKYQNKCFYSLTTMSNSAPSFGCNTCRRFLLLWVC